MGEIDNDSHSNVLDSTSPPAVPDCAPPSPFSGYSLTRDDQRRGGLARVAQRRAEAEARKRSVAEVLAERTVAEVDRILAPYFAALDAGDWRAGEALLDRHLGKAVQRQELEDVTDRDGPEVDLSELEALRAELKRRKGA